MKPQRGFTLLETLVAMVLLSLLVLALFGGFRAGVGSWRSADAHLEQMEEPRQLSGMLYRHLRHASPRAAAMAVGKGRYSFVGTADRVVYVTQLAMSADDELYVVELGRAPDGQPGVWIRFMPLERRMKFDEMLEAIGFVEAQRVSQTLQLKFSYFVDGNWTDEVTNNSFPGLVRVAVQGEDLHWPVMTIPVNAPDE